jgi:hypothetical protein
VRLRHAVGRVSRFLLAAASRARIDDGVQASSDRVWGTGVLFGDPDGHTISLRRGQGISTYLTSTMRAESYLTAQAREAVPASRAHRHGACIGARPPSVPGATPGCGIEWNLRINQSQMVTKELHLPLLLRVHAVCSGLRGPPGPRCGRQPGECER